MSPVVSKLADVTPSPERSHGERSLARMVEQQAAIAEIGQSALADKPLPVLLSEACELVRTILDVDLVDFLELEQERDVLRIIAGVGWQSDVVGSATVPTSTGSLSGYTLATGGPVIVEDLPNETRFAVLPLMTRHAIVSGISVRVGELENPYGVLAAFTTEPAAFTREDANFLQAVANVLAAAVGRRQVESQLRDSRDQLSAILGSINEGITVQGANGQLVYANDAAAQLSGFTSGAEMVSAPSSAFAERFEMFDDGGAPLSVADLPGRRLLAGEAQPPAVIGFRHRGSGDMHWSSLTATPMRAPDGSVIQVINTFRDITDERWARVSRGFMTEAIGVLSSTLDSHEAARRLTDLSVPRLADYCIVHLLEQDGTINPVAVTHVDPSRVSSVRRLQQLRPVDPADETGIASVIRENKPEHFELLTPEQLEAILRRTNTPAEEMAMVLALRIRSYIAVPLKGREGAVGALTLVMAESGRTLTERELILAEELGARAGIALENASLYQAADDRRAQLDAVLAALAEAVLVFDAAGHLRLSNKAAEELFDGRVPVTMDDLLHERLSMPRNGDEPALVDDRGHEVQLGASGRWLELRGYRAGRSTAGVPYLLEPTVVVLRDVSNQRAARAAREAFMGILSHELRTPVTTIYGGSQLLGRNLDSRHREEVVADIQIEAERLARLVEDLLVMTRVERGMVETSDEPVLIQHLLPAVADSTAERIDGLDVRLDIGDRLPAVRGDATYIEQVVRNLLTNSVRYGAARNAGVDVEAVENDGHVTVRVLDRGPGFGADDAEKLFELFYRATAARSVPGGAGIGLFVCRHLIEAMGGRMWARPRDGGGAEFGFALPVMEADFTD